MISVRSYCHWIDGLLFSLKKINLENKNWKTNCLVFSPSRQKRSQKKRSRKAISKKAISKSNKDCNWIWLGIISQCAVNWSLLWSVYSLLWSFYSSLWSVYSLLWSVYSLLWSVYSLLWSFYSLLWSIYRMPICCEMIGYQKNRCETFIITPIFCVIIKIITHDL